MTYTGSGAGIRSLFDASYYVSCYREEMAASDDPFDHFLSVGLTKGYKPNAAFDPLIYRLLHPELNGLNLLEHYIAHRATNTGSFNVSDVLPGAVREDSVRPAKGLVDTDRADLIQGKVMPQTAVSEFNVDGACYRLVSPSPEDFLSRMRRDEPFAIARLSHGDWDCLALYRRYCKRIAGEMISRSLTDWTMEQIAVLAARMCDERHHEQQMFVENFIPELLRDLACRTVHPDFFYAIAFKGYPTFDGRPFDWLQVESTADTELERLKDMAAHFPPNSLLLDATLWKRWLVTGALGELPEIARARPVILVGSNRLGMLGERWQLPWFRNVRIPPTHAYSLRHQLLKECEAALDDASAAACNGKLGRPLCLMQGSSFAYWLMKRLFVKHADVFYLDLGQALHAWFYDDRSVGLLNWGNIFAPTIVRNCRMEKYYEELGIRPPVITNLFSGRVCPEVLQAHAAWCCQ